MYTNVSFMCIYIYSRGGFLDETSSSYGPFPPRFLVHHFMMTLAKMVHRSIIALLSNRHFTVQIGFCLELV